MQANQSPTIGLVGALSVASVALGVGFASVAGGGSAVIESAAAIRPPLQLEPVLVDPPLLSSAVDADATVEVPWHGVVATFAADTSGTAIRDPLSFVEAVHPLLLGRPPSDQALESWAEQVERRLPRKKAASRMIRSHSGLRHLVSGFYQDYFARQPAPDEAGYWASQVAAGTGTRKVRALFLSSHESWVRAGSTPEGFVDRVYRLALGRAPDSAGFDHWVIRMRRGEPRHALTLDLLASDELRSRVVRQHSQRLLDRAPTATEHSAWVARYRRSGEIDALATIAGSRAFWRSLPDDWSATVEWGPGTTVAEPDVWRPVHGPDGALEVRSAHAFAALGPHEVPVTLFRSGEEVGTLTAHFEVVNPRLARWVEAAFPDTVGRDAAAAEVRAWTATARAEGRAGAARGLLLSSGGRPLLVDEVFRDHLDRGSTSAYWSDQLAAGMPLEKLRAQVLGSQEFFRAAGGTPRAWVDAVFQELLNRAPREGERVDRLERLAAGERRASIARTLLGYREAQAPLVDRLVERYLGRPAGSGERAGLVERLQGGLGEIGLRALLVAHHERFEIHERAGS